MNDLEADNMLSQIFEQQSEKLKFQMIANGKIKQIEEALKTKSESIDKEVQFMKDQLQAFFLTCNKKATKTQETYSLLSGKLVMKLPTKKIVHDDVKLESYLFQHAGNFLKETTVTKIDWAGFKKELAISNGRIINETTGQVLDDMEGLSLEDVKASFDIK